MLRLLGHTPGHHPVRRVCPPTSAPIRAASSPHRPTIRVELTQDLPVVDLNDLEKNPFDFSPSLRGKAHWLDNHTIEFVPDEGELRPGELYHGTFRLGDFLAVEENLQEFRFSFRVQPRTFTVQTEAPCHHLPRPSVHRRRNPLERCAGNLQGRAHALGQPERRSHPPDPYGQPPVLRLHTGQYPAPGRRLYLDPHGQRLQSRHGPDTNFGIPDPCPGHFPLPLRRAHE